MQPVRCLWVGLCGTPASAVLPSMECAAGPLAGTTSRVLCLHTRQHGTPLGTALIGVSLQGQAVHSTAESAAGLCKTHRSTSKWPAGACTGSRALPLVSACKAQLVHLTSGLTPCCAAGG